ncbi:MAG: putative peptidoglycan binding domain-containing protein [Chloroflexota bacterium]
MRVDDQPKPIDELKRLLDLHHLYLGKTTPADTLRVPIDAEIARELQTMMHAHGYYAGALNGAWDAATQKAFREFAGVENVEERLLDGAFIDRVVLNFLRARFTQLTYDGER